MATSTERTDDEAEAPLDLRFLRRLVMVLTGLLVAAIMVALVAIVVKLAAGESGGTGASDVPYETAVALASGELLVDSFFERGQIYLRLSNEASGAARILVFRASDGTRIGELLLQPSR